MPRTAPIRPALARALTLAACAACAAPQRSGTSAPAPICVDDAALTEDRRVVTADEIAQLQDRITPPVKLSGPDPHLTDEALTHRGEGTMLVACRVTVAGCAVGCRIVQGLPYMDEAVLDAFARRRYRPAMLDGKPVDIDYTFKIDVAAPETP